MPFPISINRSWVFNWLLSIPLNAPATPIGSLSSYASSRDGIINICHRAILLCFPCMPSTPISTSQVLGLEASASKLRSGNLWPGTSSISSTIPSSVLNCWREVPHSCQNFYHRLLEFCLICSFNKRTFLLFFTISCNIIGSVCTCVFHLFGMILNTFSIAH